MPSQRVIPAAMPTALGWAVREARDHDRHEVEQVAGDHQAPRTTVAAADGVMLEKLAERVGAEVDRVPALERCAGQELLAEMQIADDQDVRDFRHADAAQYHRRGEPLGGARNARGVRAAWLRSVSG